MVGKLEGTASVSLAQDRQLRLFALITPTLGFDVVMLALQLVPKMICFVRLVCPLLKFLARNFACVKMQLPLRTLVNMTVFILSMVLIMDSVVNVLGV